MFFLFIFDNYVSYEELKTLFLTSNQHSFYMLVNREDIKMHGWKKR